MDVMDNSRVHHYYCVVINTAFSVDGLLNKWVKDGGRVSLVEINQPQVRCHLPALAASSIPQPKGNINIIQLNPTISLLDFHLVFRPSSASWVKNEMSAAVFTVF